MKKYIFIAVSVIILYAPIRVLLIDHLIGYRVFITNTKTGDVVTFLRLKQDNYIIIGKHYFLPDTNYVKVGFSFNNEPGIDIYWNQNNDKMNIIVHHIHENKLDTNQYVAIGPGYEKISRIDLRDDLRTTLSGEYNLFTQLGMYDLFYTINGVSVEVE